MVPQPIAAPIQMAPLSPRLPKPPQGRSADYYCFPARETLLPATRRHGPLLLVPSIPQRLPGSKSRAALLPVQPAAFFPRLSDGLPCSFFFLHGSVRTRLAPERLLKPSPALPGPKPENFHLIEESSHNWNGELPSQESAC